jgi:hypothetical protein
MKFFKKAEGYCRGCLRPTRHHLFFGPDSLLHSMCEMCRKEVQSFAATGLVTGERVRDCRSCQQTTLQFRYESRRQNLFWMCSSCGREIAEPFA